ncbi:MAG: type II secretion system F family protein [bacterium]|nr:type II secretion system F family protein [bacterium]
MKEGSFAIHGQRIKARRQLATVERLRRHADDGTELSQVQAHPWNLVITLFLTSRFFQFLAVGLPSCSFAIFALSQWQFSLRTVLTVTVLAMYSLLLVKTVCLRLQQTKRERLVDYYTPLSLEALAMLMRSGLSLVPAMREVSRSLTETNPLSQLFAKINSHAAAGIEFSQALKLVNENVKEPVLIHMLTCLRNNAERGGEMLPALEQLVEHTHKQWLARVSARVRKLEAQVVLPVFCAVIGLMLLIVAVPAVPVLEMLDRLEESDRSSQRSSQRSLQRPLPRSFTLRQSSSISESYRD